MDTLDYIFGATDNWSTCVSFGESQTVARKGEAPTELKRESSVPGRGAVAVPRLSTTETREWNCGSDDWRPSGRARFIWLPRSRPEARRDHRDQEKRGIAETFGASLSAVMAGDAVPIPSPKA